MIRPFAIEMRPRSLRGILFLYVALILAALFTVRSVTYSIAQTTLMREVDRRLTAEATEIGGSRGETPLATVAARIAREEANYESADLIFLLLDPAGRRIAGQLSLPHLPPPGFSEFDGSAQVIGVAHGRVLSRRLAAGGALVIVSDNDDVDNFGWVLLLAQLAGYGLAVLIVVGGAGGIAWEVGGRLRAMQGVVDAVIAGDLSRRIPLDGSRNEFDRQAAAFNRMLDRISDLMLNIKHAAKDVTHELKGPLARLRTNLAALARQAEGQPLSAGIEDALGNADELLDLFASLLRLWEIEGGHRRKRFVDLDLAALVRETGEALTPVAEDAGHHIAIEVPMPMPTRGEPNLLRQLLVNLVENAIRHAPGGGAITISLQRHGEIARLTVSDRGPGIPADQRATAIRRFGRLDDDKNTPGQGLGLTLVDAIARLHDGALILQDARPGLKAVIDLPLAS